MYHAGIGATHVNTFLSSLNAPTMSENGIMKRQRELGAAVEKITKNTCLYYADAEKSFEAIVKISCSGCLLKLS